MNATDIPESMRLYVVSSTAKLHRSTHGTTRLGWTLCGAVHRSLNDGPLLMWQSPERIAPRRLCVTCETLAKRIGGAT